MPTYNEPLRGVSQSQAHAEAVAAAGIDDAVLYMLEIVHPDLAEPVRLVINSENVTAQLEADADTDPGEYVEWQAINFRYRLPAEADGDPAPQAAFAIDGVSAVVAQALEPAAESLEPVELVLRTYLASDLTGPSRLPPLRLQVKSIQISEQTVSAVAAYADFGNVRFPGKTFISSEHPGLNAR